MFNVTRRVSFAVAIALTVGWGIFFLLFLASSNTLLAAQQSAAESTIPLPPGVRLNVQVDKRIYRGGDVVLVAVRNDSRIPIWIEKSDDCPSAWWKIEQLGSDGETWTMVQLAKQACVTSGIEQFPTHTLKTDAWMALVPGPQIGNVMVNPPTGTYRVTVQYIKGKTAVAKDWTPQAVVAATSIPFTIQ